MGSVFPWSRKSTSILIGTVTVLCAGMIATYSPRRMTFAQDEPTDRPFPTAVTTTTAPESTEAAASSGSSAADGGGEPTDRPFPTTVPTTVGTTETIGATTTEATEATAQQAPTMTVDNAMATLTALQSENKDLQDKLASAQLDKGATLYAVVIVVIGLLLAFAVFFGLRRSGK